jgi:MtfA peptidase
MEYFYYFLITAGLVYIFWILLKPDDYHFFSKPKCLKYFDTDDTRSFRKLLLSNFVVYKLLNEAGRELFEKRVCKFIEKKNFRAGKSLDMVTDEMRIMVAASAIQLTYGYPDLYFNHFKTIILFAEEYYSAHTGYYHEGEVNAGGAIVLSWKNFMSGYSNPTDGRNLAMHEMAHALRLTNIVDNEEYDFIDRKTMLLFEKEAKSKCRKLRTVKTLFSDHTVLPTWKSFFRLRLNVFLNSLSISGSITKRYISCWQGY